MNTDDIFAVEGDFIETKDHLIFDVNGVSHPKDRIIAFLRYVPLGFFCERIASTYSGQNRQNDTPGNDKTRTFAQFQEELVSSAQERNYIGIKNIIQRFLGLEIDDMRARIDELRERNLSEDSDDKDILEDTNQNVLDRIYLKIYDIPTRYEILKRIKPEYIVDFDYYDFPLQAVPKHDIIKVYMPEITLQNLISEHNQEKGRSLTKEYRERLQYLINLLSKGAKVLVANFGLSGSPMVDLHNDTSDYDLVVYGRKNVEKLRAFLSQRFKENFLMFPNNSTMADQSPCPHIIKRYDRNQLEKHYQVRAKGFQFPLEDFIKCEQRKTHQFLIDERDVFIRYLREDRTYYNTHQDFGDRKYETIGRVTLKGIIIEDNQNYYTPAFYQMKPIEIIDYKAQTNNHKSGSLVQNSKILMNEFIASIKKGELKDLEIFTMRGRFMEQAIQGERIVVSGKLEYCISLQQKDEAKPSNYFHVVVGIDTNDHFYPI